MSAVRFRNVAVDVDAPVETWPLEAIATAIERGGLAEWRRLARAIAERPWGPVARRVEETLDVEEPYGSGPLLREVLARARTRASDDERAAVAAEVRDLVAASGLTQATLARELGTSASRLSTYATGRVVPAATFLVRLRRTVDLLAADARAPGTTLRAAAAADGARTIAGSVDAGTASKRAADDGSLAAAVPRS